MKLIDRVREILKIDRAIAMPNIYGLVYAELDKQMQADEIYRALIDVYLDGPTMYAVVAMNGLLYKYDIMLTSSGVAMGIPVQVEINYAPVAQSIHTTRQANGKYRWFAFPAATAVLNRSGELDSRQLFESFVKRIESGEAEYPFLSFYHVGEKINLGRADYVAVDGYTLLMSGTWDDEPLAQATRRAIEANPDYYGISIGYKYQPESKERLTVSEGISIPVYTDGVLVECSILAEKDAACLYTGAYTEGVNRMNSKAKTELEKIAGDDPALVALVGELVTQVDSVNQDIETKNLVRRESTEAAPAEPVAPVVEAAPAEIPAPVADPPVFEMTDEAMQALAERVSTSVAATFTEQLQAVDTKHADAIAAQSVLITQLTARIAELEKPLEVSVQQAIQDMPRNKTLVVGYRPRLKNQTAEQPEEMTPSEIAAETLAKLKQ